MRRINRSNSGSREFLLPILLAVALLLGRPLLSTIAEKLYRQRASLPFDLPLEVPDPVAVTEQENMWERELLELAAKARRAPGSSFRRRHVGGREQIEAQLSAPPRELLELLHRLSQLSLLRRFSITPEEGNLFTLYLEAER